MFVGCVSPFFLRAVSVVCVVSYVTIVGCVLFADCCCVCLLCGV